MMNEQLPISGNGAGTIVFGDLTFVQNHNFGQDQMNPMLRMQMNQQAMMIQQQQQQNQMLMLGMAKIVKDAMAIGASAANETLKLANPVVEKEPLAVEYSIKEEDDEGFRVKPNKIKTIFDDMDDSEEIQHVEYEITSDEPVKTHFSNLIPKHMKEFFDENGDICAKTNKFLKVAEDKKTFAIFIDMDTLKCTCEWKDVFRKAYLTVTKSTFKTPEMSSMSDPDAKFIAVTYRKSVKDIGFVFKDNSTDLKACSDYAKDTHQEFRSVHYFVSPEVSEGFANPLKIEDLASHKEQSLFGNGYYVAKDKSF